MKAGSVKSVSAFEYFRLANFSKPVEDRAIFKMIRKQRFRSIIEVGLGDGSRSEKLIRLAHKYGACSGVRYTGVDLFDGRDEDQSPLSLRDMHKRLSSMDAKVQLVPGDLFSALARIANSHVRTDLIIVSAGQTRESIAPCWFYFPRMLHAGSKFMIQYHDTKPYKTLSRLEIEKRAEQKIETLQPISKAA